MKKFYSLAVAALMAASVSATETPVTSWTFDDASSPVLDNSTGTGTTADYSHAAVVGNVGSGNNFLNAYRAANGNGELKATITAENLTSAAKWVLEFDFAGFSGCNNNAGQTIIADAEGNAILTITDAAGWGSTFALSDGNTIACYACERTNRGSANTGNQLSATYWHHFTITGGASGIKMTVARYKADGTLGDEVISKSQLSSTNATPSSISIKAGSWGSMGIDNLSLVTSDEADVVYNYTVKYVDMYEGGEIKDAAVRSDEEGASITLTAADKADFYTADGLSKYIYYSDDSKNKQVSPDGSTVVTVSFIPADIYDFTVNAVYGSNTKEITSGTSFDGDAVTVGYPKYIYDEENGALYTSGNYPFQTTFTPDQPGYKQSVIYTLAEEGTNVVFYAEAEDIEGVNAYKDDNIGVRMSNGAVGEADSVAVATLPAGKYTLTSSSRSGDTNFYVDGEKILTVSSTGSVTDATSSEFIIKKNGTNVMAKNVLTSGHKNYFDYVLIRKTGDVNYTEIKALKDTVVIEKDPSFSLNNIVTITSSADWSQFEGFNLVKNAKLGIAAAGEGTDKATATYSESSVFDALPTFSTIGDYYVYVKLPVTYQDQSTEDAISDTLVVQVKDVYYLNVEENLPDTIKYLKGTDDDMKPMLSNYMTAVSDGVLSAEMFIANAIEGVTKEDATYAGYGTEEDAKNAMSTPGAYFAYGVVTASYDDKDPLTYTTDTIVIVVSDPNQFEIETVLEYQEIANNATADEVKDFFTVYATNTTDLNLYIGVAKAENDEADKADLSYDEYNAEEFDQNFEPGTYYIYMRGLAAFENGDEATAKSDTVCLVVSEAAPAEEVITDWTFDNNQSPSFTVETGEGSTNQDYSHNAVIGEEYDGNKFLNAWGDNNTNSTLTATITDQNLSEAGQWTLEFDFAGYSGCNKRAGTFSILDPNGQSIMSITDAADWQNTFSISDGSTFECYPCNRDTRLKNDCGNVLTAKYWHHFKLVGNSTGVKMTVSKYDAEGQLGDPIIVKSQVSATNATPSVFSVKAGSASSFAFDNLILYYTTEEPEASPYVVKYMCGDEEIKPDANRSDEAGAEIILSPSDTENFTVDGQKYIYDSDDAEGKVVSAEEVVVVTVNFHKAALVDYSVYVDPNESGDYIFVYGGQNFEDETIKIGFPGRFEIDGVIYEGVKGESDDSKGFAKTVTLGKNNSFVFTVNETQTNNVVFFSEAENIEGLTLCDNGNTAIRSSMGASAYAESEDVTITTLPVGVYKIVSVACDAAGKNASAVFSYKAGDEVIFTQTCGAINWDEQTSEEFTVTENGTEIKLVQGGNEKQGIDLVYIIKTGEYDPTAVDGVAENVEGAAPVKFVKNGQLIIATGNKQFNAAGGQLK
ncbi:MAG: hypothetical protein IKQ12_10930 [Prevotella sp.]|nr:hypothetical protein [Prevotella sp.]